MISIIIPVYNAAPFLDHCIKSIVQQTYSHWELILVNDGSTDNSGAICDNWATKDKRISVIHQNNKGVSATRNAGIKAAQGEYILFLDSDDALRCDTCEVLMNYEAKSAADCITFGFQQESGSVWAPTKDAIYTSKELFKTDFIFWLNTELLSSSVNKLYKRTLIHQLFQENISYGEDLIFCLSYLNQCTKFQFITERLYLHNNLNKNSITHTFKKQRIDDIECWQLAILNFAADMQHSPDLFTKYFKDVSFYLKKLYGCKDINYSEKKKILKEWYPKSALSQLTYTPSDSWVNQFLLKCTRHKLWILPYILLQVKRLFLLKS